jgi:hypothetical protein
LTGPDRSIITISLQSRASDCYDRHFDHSNKTFAFTATTCTGSLGEDRCPDWSEVSSTQLCKRTVAVIPE